MAAELGEGSTDLASKSGHGRDSDAGAAAGEGKSLAEEATVAAAAGGGVGVGVAVGVGGGGGGGGGGSGAKARARKKGAAGGKGSAADVAAAPAAVAAAAGAGAGGGGGGGGVGGAVERIGDSGGGAVVVRGGGEGGGDGDTALFQRVSDQLKSLSMKFGQAAGNGGAKRHAFWETQPVGQFQEDDGSGWEDGLVATGPIDANQRVEDVRKEPYNLPTNFEWCTCDVDSAEMIEEIYNLLTNNYVEDDDNMFRFDYSVSFLRWALKPPRYFKSWHVGVRAKSSRKLVAFITGVPAKIRVENQLVPMAEINFLCVHKKLRAKRLAPVLIKEVTRRVQSEDIWQAAYTAGVVIPKPIATCQYWHRSLNPKKLIDVGFSRLAPRMTMSRTIKLYHLPTETKSPGFRQTERRDIPAVTALLTDYLAQFKVAPLFSEDDVAHQLMPIKDVVNSYVVEDPKTKQITDMCSFYTLPSTVIGNENYKVLKAAYSYYNVAKKTPLLQLMNDALIMAKRENYDVFNALDIMENQRFLKELKFGPGDGHLHYYLYNFRVHGVLKPPELGLVLL
ncbi:hypothetical protein CBR_g20984 [Chara braunii]|uniref:Glycylpeptide N-tetradecanoyltransferase n=1 Tax=Chara braunii TaxID=69332 RepID=A0A388L0A2_CHABU|nr:hypothetical protein CBR_g20984 [Chara braunii]|eukprot:GBG75737.1 hypothetical protein CBR_g20984 [Chara braunii]